MLKSFFLMTCSLTFSYSALAGQSLCQTAEAGLVSQVDAYLAPVTMRVEADKTTMMKSDFVRNALKPGAVNDLGRPVGWISDEIKSDSTLTEMNIYLNEDEFGSQQINAFSSGGTELAGDHATDVLALQNFINKNKNSSWSKKDIMIDQVSYTQPIDQSKPLQLEKIILFNGDFKEQEFTSVKELVSAVLMSKTCQVLEKFRK